MTNKLVLLFFFPLPVFVGCPEHEIHDEYLVGDDERDEEDGVVLGLGIQIVDEEYHKIAVVDHLPEQNDLVEY
jgi:hypothetical protein